MGKYDFSEERRATNEELGDAMKTLQGLSAEQLVTVMPKGTDKERLDELIGLVNQAADDNEKLRQMYERWTSIGETVLGVVKTVVTRGAS